MSGSTSSPPAAARPRTRRSELGPLLLGGILFLGAWQAIVWLGGYAPFILPGPLAVAGRFARAWADGTMAPHALTTLAEVLSGFVVGAALAVPIGVLLARSRFAARLLSPYIVAAQATPILAIAPLLALWFGTGPLSKVAVCGLIVFFPIAVSTMVGLRSVDARLVEMARAFRADRSQTIRAVEIPAALPAILGGMRVSATLAVIGAIVGEWAGGGSGLGVLVNLARGSLFDTPLLFATLATIALLGLALYFIVVLVERRLVGARG
ncbi:MAG: ABC transporter permease [Candidatus Limnocylindrales bacterium]